MKIYVLGSGVGVPSEKRSYPGLFVDSEKTRVLIDPGPGSISRLRKLDFSYRDVDAIVITHFHPDHCLDLISFLFACRYPLEPREERLLVVGAAGLKKFYEGAVKLFNDAIVPQKYELALKEVSDEAVVSGTARITAMPVAHTEDSIGVRIRAEGGEVFCYSGDTDYCENMIKLARDADLLALECSFPDEGKVKGHLTPSWAGRIAREASVKKLLLTHLYPVCGSYDIIAQCRKEYKGEIQLAEDLMQIAL